MEQLLTPEFVLSTGVGGGAVYAAMRIHLAYVLERIKGTERRIGQLELMHMQDRRHHHGEE